MYQCPVYINTLNLLVACSDSSDNTPEPLSPSETIDNNGIPIKLEGVYDIVNSEAQKILEDPDKCKAELEKIAKDIKADPAKAFEKAGLGSFLEPGYTSIPFGVALIAIGLLLALMGRRIFKMFLSISGFIVGGAWPMVRL